jgi:AbrB family looped-hinge helix DNA binding protein
MTELYPAKVGRQHRITIPEPLMKKYGIETGDNVILVDKNGKLTIVPPKEYLKSMK